LTTRALPLNSTDKIEGIRASFTTMSPASAKRWNVDPVSCLKITIKNGRVEQGNFDSYRILRMNEAPPIDVHVVENSQPPGGMGETGTSLIVPAVANAIFAATGKRLRKMPVNPNDLKQRA
jgi:hypothetical protein